MQHVAAQGETDKSQWFYGTTAVADLEFFSTKSYFNSVFPYIFLVLFGLNVQFNYWFCLLRILLLSVCELNGIYGIYIVPFYSAEHSMYFLLERSFIRSYSTFIYVWVLSNCLINASGQLRVQHLAQGHFGTQLEEPLNHWPSNW